MITLENQVLLGTQIGKGAFMTDWEGRNYFNSYIFYILVFKKTFIIMNICYWQARYQSHTDQHRSKADCGLQ